MGLDRIVGILGLFGTLFFGVASIILWFKSFRPKVLAWTYTLEELSIIDADDRVRVSFDGNMLSALCFAKVMIWNSGRVTISGDEIARSDPLRIKPPERMDILSSRISKSTGSATAASIAIDASNREVKFEFDVLNPGDGFLIDLVMSNRISGPVKLLGTIRNVERISEVSLQYGEQMGTVQKRITISAAFMFALFMSIFVTLVSVIGFGITQASNWIYYLLLTLFCLGGVFIGINLVRTQWVNIIPDLLTSELQKNSVYVERFGGRAD